DFAHAVDLSDVHHLRTSAPTAAYSRRWSQHFRNTDRVRKIALTRCQIAEPRKAILHTLQLRRPPRTSATRSQTARRRHGMFTYVSLGAGDEPRKDRMRRRCFITLLGG